MIYSTSDTGTTTDSTCGNYGNGKYYYLGTNIGSDDTEISAVSFGKYHIICNDSWPEMESFLADYYNQDIKYIFNIINNTVFSDSDKAVVELKEVYMVIDPDGYG